MNSKDQAKQLKAFAKRRQTRPEGAVFAEATERETLRAKCLEIVTQAILSVRREEPDLRDSAVIEALRYESREPGAKLSSGNLVHTALENACAEHAVDPQVWRSALKALLKMSDPISTPNRNPTQLLDLIETVSR